MAKSSLERKRKGVSCMPESDQRVTDDSSSMMTVLDEMNGALTLAGLVPGAPCEATPSGSAGHTGSMSP